MQFDILLNEQLGTIISIFSLSLKYESKMTPHSVCLVVLIFCNVYDGDTKSPFGKRIFLHIVNICLRTFLSTVK